MKTLHTVAALLGDILSEGAGGIGASFRLTGDNGVTPIDIARLAIACERAFRIPLHDENIAQWKTIGDVCAHIELLLEEGLAEPALRTDEERTAWFYE